MVTHMATTPNVAQPIFWGRGFICPYHENLKGIVGLTMDRPGHLYCDMCKRVFTQRKNSLGFDVTKQEDGVIT